MENKVKRPFLLTGLILTTVCFGLLSISSIVLLGTLFAAGGLTSTTEEQVMLNAMLFVSVLMLAVSVCGLVFSAISLSRWNLPAKEFDKKKGLITTTFVFAVIVAILELIGMTTSFDVLVLLMTIALIVGAVFIMIDRCKNSALLEKENQAAAENTSPVEVKADEVQENAENVENVENKTE